MNQIIIAMYVLAIQSTQMYVKYRQSNWNSGKWQGMPWCG